MGTLRDEARRRVDMGEFEQGILLLQVHLRAFPGDLPARQELRDLARTHRCDTPSTRRAIARAAHALTINPSAPLDTLPLCEQLLERDPDSVPALTRLGQAAMRGGLREVGVWAFKEALALSPRDPEVLIALDPFCTSSRDCFRLGRALYTQGLCAQAAGPLKRAALTEDYRAQAGFLLGQCLLKLGRPVEATSALRSARRGTPTGSVLWNDITYLLGRIPDRDGDVERAAQHYRELAKAGGERSLFALAERSGTLRVVTDLRPEVCDRAAVDAIPETFATTYGVCPLAFEDGALVIALSDPVHASQALDDLRFMLNQDVVGAVADPDQVRETIAALYAVRSDARWPWPEAREALVCGFLGGLRPPNPPVGSLRDPTIGSSDRSATRPCSPGGLRPPNPPSLRDWGASPPRPPVPHGEERLPCALAALPAGAPVQAFPPPAPCASPPAEPPVLAAPAHALPPLAFTPPPEPPAPLRPRRPWFTAEGAAAAVSAAATFLLAIALILELGLLP